MNHKYFTGKDGHIHVKNSSAFWIPDFKLKKEIGGTVYSVTGSYDGTETIDKKLSRIFSQGIGNAGDKVDE